MGRKGNFLLKKDLREFGPKVPLTKLPGRLRLSERACFLLMMRLGVHCSIRKGYLQALQEAQSLSCTAMQMFSYRRHREPDPVELEAFRSALVESGIELFIHARYLPALVSEEEKDRLHSEELLVRELRLAKALGSSFLVVHAGAYFPGSSWGKGAGLFVRTCAGALEKAACGVSLVLENVPGGGRRMGGSLEELSRLGELLEKKGHPLFFCLDSAHAWAFGYPIDSEKGMKEFLDLSLRVLGREKIRLFHLNDSLAERRSFRENHCHWGEGKLGSEGLKLLLRSGSFPHSSFILETPKGEEEDRRNMEWVRGLC